MGSGGLIVMDEDTCMVDIARFFLDFTQEETCGKCPPCRVGTKRMLEILERITDGKGEEGDIEQLIALGRRAGPAGGTGAGPRPVLHDQGEQEDRPRPEPLSPGGRGRRRRAQRGPVRRARRRLRAGCASATSTARHWATSPP